MEVLRITLSFPELIFKNIYESFSRITWSVKSSEFKNVYCIYWSENYNSVKDLNEKLRSLKLCAKFRSRIYEKQMAI